MFNYGSISVIVFVLIFSISDSSAQNISGGFDLEGHHRVYKLFLPQNYSDTIKFPLIIYLHAYGWTAEQDMNYTQFYKVADTSGFIVVYPSGVPNWNSGIADNKKWPATGVDDVRFINALIDSLSSEYSIDPGRVFACGYSNGGFMAYRLACQLGNRIAAIASVGGIMSYSVATNCNPTREVPVLQIHGTADWWVPVNGSEGWHSVDETVSYWTTFNNCTNADTILLPDLSLPDSCVVEKISYTNCTGNCEVIYYKVLQGGHTWPGAGSPGFSHEGFVNDDINANVEIINFFNKFKLNR